MTNFNFDNAVDVGFEPMEALPKGTLAYAQVIVEEDKVSENTGNKMLQCTYKLLGAYEGREIRYQYLVYSGKNKNGVPNEYQALGRVKAILLTSCLELNSFKEFKDVNNCIVGVKLGIDKKTNAATGQENTYNNIMCEISPDKESKTHKDYLALVEKEGLPPLEKLTGDLLAETSIDEDDIPL